MTLRGVLKDNILVIAIATAVGAAVLAPGPGLWLAGLGLVSPLLMLIFLCQGMSWQPSSGTKGRGLARLFLWGLAVSQVLGPLTGWALARVLPLEADFAVGLVLMCCMAPTLVSGAVLAGRAGGDVGAALLLAVGVNLAAVFTVPLTLGWALGAEAQLNVWGLLYKLVFLVLLPALAGRAVAAWRPRAAQALAGFNKQVPTLALAVIIYMEISRQVGRLSALPADQLLTLAAASLAAHYILLAVAYWVARRPLDLGLAASRSLALVTSQKTLPLAVAVWSLSLADQHPLAVLAPMVFHPSQILGDGVLANFWARRTVAS